MQVLLVLTKSPSWDEALCFARQTVLKTEGSLSLLAVGAEAAEIDELRKTFSAQLTPQEHTSLNIRYGNFHEQVQKETQKGDFDLTVIGADPAGDEDAPQLTPAAHLARMSQTPLAIVQACPQDLHRALICSREPDLDLPTVRTGQELATRMGIVPTVLHVQTLAARGHESTDSPSESILIRHGPLISEIQEELERQVYDMVIIGPHSVPPTGSKRGPTLAKPDFAHQIVQLSPPIVIIAGQPAKPEEKTGEVLGPTELRRIARSVAVQLLIYVTLVTTYSIIAFRFLKTPLATMFENNLFLYAIAAVVLVMAQGTLLEQLTSFLLDRLRLERFD